MKNKAFTFVEVLIVIAICGLIAAIAIPACLKNYVPKLNGTILKKEVEEYHYKGTHYRYYITLIETNRHMVESDYYDHVHEGQYVYHE